MEGDFETQIVVNKEISCTQTNSSSGKENQKR